MEDTEICDNNQSDDDDDAHEPSKAFTFLVSVGMRDSVYETIAECWGDNEKNFYEAECEGSNTDVTMALYRGKKVGEQDKYDEGVETT